MFHKVVLAEILDERVVSSRNRRNPRGVKRRIAKFPVRSRDSKKIPPINVAECIAILK